MQVVTAAATRSSSRFTCHAQLSTLAQLSTTGHQQVECLLTYKCLHGLAADYLTRLCVHVATVGGRSRLRSSDDINCSSHRRTHNATLGLCAFSISGPASWNDLPALLCDPAVTLGTFRQMLKSFLFD